MRPADQLLMRRKQISPAAGKGVNDGVEGCGKLGLMGDFRDELS